MRVLCAIAVHRILVIVGKMAGDEILGIADGMTLVHQFRPSDVVDIQGVLRIDTVEAVAAIPHVDRIETLRAILGSEEEIPAAVF